MSGILCDSITDSLLQTLQVLVEESLLLEEHSALTSFQIHRRDLVESRNKVYKQSRKVRGWKLEVDTQSSSANHGVDGCEEVAKPLNLTCKFAQNIFPKHLHTLCQRKLSLCWYPQSQAKEISVQLFQYHQNGGRH